MALPLYIFCASPKDLGNSIIYSESYLSFVQIIESCLNLQGTEDNFHFDKAVCKLQLNPKSIQKIRTFPQMFMKERKLIEELL